MKINYIFGVFFSFLLIIGCAGESTNGPSADSDEPSFIYPADKFSNVAFSPLDSTAVYKRFGGEYNGDMVVRWEWITPQKKLKREYYEVRRQKEGIYVDYFKSGKMKRLTEFSKGEKNGLEYTWYDTGEVRNKTEFKKGKKTGVYMGWHKNGKKQYQGKLKNNMPDGEIVYWNEGGHRVDAPK